MVVAILLCIRWIVTLLWHVSSHKMQSYQRNGHAITTYLQYKQFYGFKPKGIKITNYISISKKEIGIENATSNRLPSAIDQKDGDLISMETRRIQKLKDQKSMETRRRL